MKKNGYLSLALSALLGLSLPVSLYAGPSHALNAKMAQPTKKISGIVVDAKGEPIIGANVVEKGTTNGTITNYDGNFTLNVAQGKVLLVTYVGYKNVTVKITSNSVYRIVLEEDAEMLGDVVVVGYGTQKKENLTGAVATVDVNKALDSRPLTDVGRGLQGTTPGLSITQPSAEVGTDAVIKIRGQVGSAQGSTSPLILLDNVEIPSLQLVNPDDIESISVLKDAASVSIYGSKAAFGVVLITTKKGSKTDAVEVNYSGNFSWQSPAQKAEMGAYEAMEYAMIAAENAGSSKTGAFYKVTRAGLERAKEWQETYGGKLGPNDPTIYGRDWYVDEDGNKIGLRTYNPYDYIIKDSAPTMTHNLSVSGKAGNTTFNIAMGMVDQSGMNKNAKIDDFKKHNLSARISTEINKYVTLRAGLLYSKDNKRYPLTTPGRYDQWYYLYRWGPQYPMNRNANGDMMRGPAAEFAQANIANRQTNYTSARVGFTVNIMKGWTFDFDYTYANTDYTKNQPGVRFHAANTWGAALKTYDDNGNRVYVDKTGAVVNQNAPNAMPAYHLNTYTYTAAGNYMDAIYRYASNRHQNTLNMFTTYNFDLNKIHKFKLMAGLNKVTVKSEYNWSQAKELTDITNPQFDLAIGTQTASGGKGWEAQMGYFGRVNYSLLDRYLFEANIRRDGSSKFPTDLKWRTFTSFSAGWRVSEEAFMDWAKPVLSTLKLRGSWGSVGDQTVPNSLYESTMGSGQFSWLDSSGNKMVYVGAPSSVSSTVSWQNIETLDLGLDVRLLDNRLGLTFDWYQRDTKDMLVPTEGIPDTYGASAPMSNTGALRTRGWELAIDYNHRFENGLSLNGMFTISDAKTTIQEYGTNQNINYWYAGKEYGEIWGFRTDRLYQESDFVREGDGFAKVWAHNGKEVPAGTPGAKLMNKLSDPNGVYQDYLQGGKFVYGPGDVKYQDVNGDGKVTRGSQTVDDHGDLERIGNSTPRFEYGIRLGANYKGFDASIFMQGVGSRDLWGNSSMSLPGFNTADGAIAKSLCTNYWTTENTGAFYPRPWNMGNGTNAYNMCRQDRYLLDMSYLRVKNITLGYTLPADLIKKVLLKKARVYVSLENILTFDNLDDLPIDPETVPGSSIFATSGNNYGGGRLGIGAPAFKSISVGVQLSF
jgi:TonB-linked SusC/RagA family outer membrane protein